MENYLKYEQKFITAVDEFDYLERIKLSALMQYFQDLATSHAGMIGVGFLEMKAQNLCWILSRLSLKIDSFPKLGEQITVTTFPRFPGLVDATRDYFVTDSSGKNIVHGTSKWCVLDINSHAIRRCSPLFKFDASKYYPLELYENGNQKIEDISEICENAQSVFCGDVRITDLDRNKHMNNARYGDIVLNSCDINFLSKNRINEFDINFVSELKMGDSFSVLRTVKNEYTYFEGIKNGSLKNVVFKARIKWEEDNDN